MGVPKEKERKRGAWRIFEHINDESFPNLMENKRLHIKRGFPDSSEVKNRPANAGDLGLIPGLGRHPWEGNGNTL